MGSYAVTAGTVKVRDCPDVREILEDLKSAVEGRDEREITIREPEPGILEMQIYIAGFGSAHGACEIDMTVQRFGAYTVQGACFNTEWDREQGRFYVGNREQITRIQSEDAAAEIIDRIPLLAGDDGSRVLHEAIAGIPKANWKRLYLKGYGVRCPFCGKDNLRSSMPQTEDGVIVVAVECFSCGHAWNDVYSLVDVTEAVDKKGNPVPDDARCHGESRRRKKGNRHVE